MNRNNNFAGGISKVIKIHENSYMPVEFDMLSGFLKVRLTYINVFIYLSKENLTGSILEVTSSDVSP